MSNNYQIKKINYNINPKIEIISGKCFFYKEDGELVIISEKTENGEYKTELIQN